MKRLLPFILAILFVVGAFISVPLFLNPERHRPEITELMSHLLKKQVVIGPMSMGYFPPTLKLNQVAVMKQEGLPLLDIGLVSAPLDFASLYHFQFVPTSIQLMHWKLNLTRRADGSWDAL